LPATIIALVLIGTVLVAGGWTADGRAGPPFEVVPFPVDSTILADGAELITFSDGSKVVGTAGSTVAYQKTDEDGDGHADGSAIAVTPPDPGTDTAIEAMANLYSAQGRSPAQDAVDLGATDIPDNLATSAQVRRVQAQKSRTQTTAACVAGQIWDSGTASIVDAHVTEKGAYRRFTTCDQDPNNAYTFEESQVSGQGKNPCTIPCAVKDFGTEHFYGKGSITKWQPGGDMTSPNDACQTQTIGMSYQGVSISKSVNVCPSKIHPNIPFNDFKVQWQGCTNNKSTKSAEAMSSDKVVQGGPSQFTYYVYYHWNNCNL
jgi:hypothetical protein